MLFVVKSFHGKERIHIAFFDGPDREHLELSGRLILTQLGWESFRKLKAAEGDELIFERSEVLI